ncbi:acyl-CoA thioester hydrolase/BAAT C-terminal domain-containing protein [Corynebacterium freiburgense]|uniref:acyl-CoA thioester hydrolase/BAAT C-terminal domain-containing protein n=1 Tax=Corynebacterium freiburgense TaxID=556548 RepID=UPI00047D22CB|nr:acyl-CoA thioester hydrolase/BAAT C-terminal domain-containing protein [Corynebacterium freiburgense]
MKIARILLRIGLIFVAILVVLVALVFGIRAWNTSSWKNSEIASAPPPTEGITVSDFQGEYARGYHLVPDEKKHPGTIVTFGGSEGSADTVTAAKLAAEGHEVYALYYFGQPGQKETLENVPLELFNDVLPNLSKPITVMGGSKGAELALLLSTYYPEIDNVALVAPTMHHWQGLGGRMEYHPSFTWEDKPIPYINFSQADGPVLFWQAVSLTLAKPVTFEPTYSSALKNTPEAEREQARIKIEKTKARLFIVAGEKDELWGSSTAAKDIQQRVGDRAEVHIYPDGGHALGAPDEVGFLRLGGTEEANKAMAEDSHKKLLQWLP